MTEEQVEYRDENGKLLDEDEVKALEGKVSFSTRYETRTRLIDANGNPISEGVHEESSAPALPEAEELKTPEAPKVEADKKPAANDAKDDLAKEKKLNAQKDKTASPSKSIAPASEQAKDEL